VVVRAAGRDDAAELAGRLTDEGLAVARRWSYVVVGAETEEVAQRLADRLRREVANAEVSVEANVSDLPSGPFQFVGL
jgi:hypothetical protein